MSSRQTDWLTDKEKLESRSQLEGKRLRRDLEYFRKMESDLQAELEGLLLGKILPNSYVGSVHVLRSCIPRSERTRWCWFSTCFISCTLFLCSLSVCKFTNMCFAYFAVLLCSRICVLACQQGVVSLVSMIPFALCYVVIGSVQLRVLFCCDLWDVFFLFLISIKFVVAHGVLCCTSSVLVVWILQCFQRRWWECLFFFFFEVKWQTYFVMLFHVFRWLWISFLGDESSGQYGEYSSASYSGGCAICICNILFLFLWVTICFCDVGYYMETAVCFVFLQEFIFGAALISFFPPVHTCWTACAETILAGECWYVDGSWWGRLMEQWWWQGLSNQWMIDGPSVVSTQDCLEVASGGYLFGGVPTSSVFPSQRGTARESGGNREITGRNTRWIQAVQREG